MNYSELISTQWKILCLSNSYVELEFLNDPLQAGEQYVLVVEEDETKISMPEMDKRNKQKEKSPLPKAQETPTHSVSYTCISSIKILHPKS